MEEKDQEKSEEISSLNNRSLELRHFASCHSRTLRDDNIIRTDSLTDSLNDYSSGYETELTTDSSDLSKTEKKFYFEIIISLFLFINSFIYFSYLNIFHLLFSYFLLFSKYSTSYNNFLQKKGGLTFFLYILDLVYTIIKIIVDSYYSITGKEILKVLFPLSSWKNIYEYVILGINLISLFIYLVVKDFSKDSFTRHDKPTNIGFMKKLIQNNNNFLNLGVFLICIGCTIYPSIVNLFLLICTLIFFYSQLINESCRKFFKIHLKFLFIFIIVVYTIYNYILNSNSLIIDNVFLGKITIFLEDENNKGDIETYILGVIPFYFFYFAFFFINIHIKCLEYALSTQKENFNRKYSEEKIIINNSHNNSKEIEDEENLGNDFYDYRTGTFIINKEKEKLQTLFDTDIDCGIIFFSKECKNYSFPKKLQLLILKFCYTSGFCLHTCRACVILWINCYMTYISICLILWLIFSINYSNSKYFLFGTKFIIYPLLIIIFGLSYVSTIFNESFLYFSNNGYFFGINENQNLGYNAIHMSIKILIITMFQLFLHLKTNHSKNLRDSEIKAEIKKQKKELEKKIEEDFSGRYVIKPIEIFFKTYFIFLDFAVIIFFYISITQNINIFNEVVLFIIISLFFIGKKFLWQLRICLILLNISFLLKYALYFYNNFSFDPPKTNIQFILSIIFNDNLQNIHYYWISYYLLFLEYIGQTSKLFKLCNSKHFSIYEIVEYNFHSHPFLKFILITIFNFIFGIYIWLLVPCFIYYLLLRDNNFLGLIQFLIVFIIYYKYIKIVGNQYNSSSNIFRYTFILIIFNAFNIVLIYIIQLANKPPISIWFELYFDKYKTNLELLGLFIFDEKYSKNLRGFFIMFAISIALHVEISRQISINTKNPELKKEAKKHSDTVKINAIKHDNEDDIFSDKGEEGLLPKEEDSDIYNNMNNNNEKEINNDVQNKEKLEKNKSENILTQKAVHKIARILYYILHYYWIIIFIFVAFLSLHWMLSVSMVIQLTFFCYYMAKSFKGYYDCLKKKELSCEKKTFSLKMKKYLIEKNEHFVITSETQHNYFNLIWVFTFTSIILSYLCSIILKYLQSYNIDNKNNEIFSCNKLSNEDSSYNENLINLNEKYRTIVSIIYILGFYSAPQDKINHTNFWSYTWGYFMTILLFSIRAYILSKFAEINVRYLNREKAQQKINRKFSKYSRQSKILQEFEKTQGMNSENNFISYDLENYVNTDFDLNDNNNTSFDNNNQNDNDINYDFLISNTEANDNNDQEKITLRKYDSIKKIRFNNRDEVEKNRINIFKNKLFEQEYLEYFYESKLFSFSKDDFGIDYKKHVNNKNIVFNISMQINVKKFLELFIILLIFISALLKCNILSFLFLLMILISHKQKNIKTSLMFKYSFIILIILVCQYIVFVSNLSPETNTFIDSQLILPCFDNNITHIPWTNKLSLDPEWITFLSLGTSRYQIIILWIDVIIVLFLYFYLEYFSFTIYEKDSQEDDLENIYAKYNHKFKKLKTISKNEYNSFVRAMKVSYDIELEPPNEKKLIELNSKIMYKPSINNEKQYNKTFLKISYLFKNDKRYLNVRKTQKIDRYLKLTSFMYISFHYLLLFSTLLICAWNQGLIGLGYMIFSIYYLYKSHCFLKGRRWTLLFGINYFMKPFVFLDILTQFILQIPFQISKNTDEWDLFGCVQIAVYTGKKIYIYPGSFFFVLVKIFAYFLLCFQQNIYLSYNFKKFILKYHYKYMNKAYIKGKLHSFLFNNYRVKLMKDRLIDIKNITQSLFTIQSTVNNWNISLTNYSKNEDSFRSSTRSIQKNIYEIPINHSSIKKKGKGITIKKILRKHWLVSLTLSIIESARNVDNEHFNICGEIMKILQGNTVLYSYLYSLIEDFEKKNFDKYNDVRNLRRILQEKNKNLKKKSKRNTKESVLNSIDEVEDEEDYEIKRQNSLINMNNENEDMKIDDSLRESFRPDITKKRGSFNFGNNNKNQDEEDIDFFLQEKNTSVRPSVLTVDSFYEDKSDGKEKYIKLAQKYDDMFFANADYVQLKKIIREDFFDNYCSRKKVFAFLISALVNYFLENFGYVVYFFMIINHLINGTVLSLFYPIYIFLFGIIQFPRPAKIFWKIALVYTALLIFLKFLIQLIIWDKITPIRQFFENINENSIGFIANLGLRRIEKNNYLGFASYVIPDFVVLIMIIINQFRLIRKGLWYNTEVDYETIEESNNRIMKFNSKIIYEKYGYDTESKRKMNADEILNLIGKMKTPIKRNFFKRIGYFCEQNFTRKRNEKPGEDFYIYYTVFLIFILIYIIFFYTNMEQDKMVYNVDTFKLKQFSGHMVIFAFIHVFLLVFDRFIYLKNARKLQRILFKVYNKVTGEDITMKYSSKKYEDVVNSIEKEKDNKYEIIAYQYEDCQFGLLMKYITQIIMVFFIHLFIYFYLPYISNSYQQNSDQSTNKISENFYILIFYILYLFYFIFSGLQIKHGLTDIKKVSALMKASNFFYYVTYRAFKEIPFLFELKNFIDWTFTKTSLDLWKWLKLEEILSLLYINKCLTKSEIGRRIGTKVPLHMKMLMGSTTFFAVILIIFGPLVLFSSLNPINLVNHVIGVDLKIILSISTSNSHKLNLTLFETSNSYINNFDNENEYYSYMDSLKNITNVSDIYTYKKSYKYEQVQKVTVVGYTERNWDVSSQFINYLKYLNINDYNYDLSIKYSFLTEVDSSTKYSTTETKINLSPKIIKQFKNILLSEGKHNETKLFLENFYSPYQRIQNDDNPVPLSKAKNNLNLVLNIDEDKIYNWFIYTNNNTIENKSEINNTDIDNTDFNKNDINNTDFNNNTNNDTDINNNTNITSNDTMEEGIEFTTFTDLYSAATIGYDVLTFYISFVIVAGKVIRLVFLGQAERIMYIDMVNPNRLIGLCEGIKISRIKNDYLQEEKLYYLLIDLMRSPEIIKNMTQSSLVFIQDNNVVKEIVKENEHEVESRPILPKKRVRNNTMHKYHHI